MDRRSRPGPEPTTLEAVGDQWHYTLVVVQAGDDDDAYTSHTHNHPPTHTFCQIDSNICTAGITSLAPITSCTFGEPGLTMIPMWLPGLKE